MVLMAHATGNANVREAARSLEEHDLLAEFWTCTSWAADSPWNQIIPAALRRQLQRRTLPPRVRRRTHHFPWREMGRMLASQVRWSSLSARGPLSIDAVFRSLDRRVARRVGELPGLRGVYAYEDGAACTFAAARRLGVKCIYDLPIGYWRAAHAIYAEEREREPEWACTLTGMNDSPEKLRRKDQELELADVVLVASQFTKKTIAAAPHCPAAIHVIPYGAPPSAAPAGIEHLPGEKLRVLFAGSLGQRKGISYLLRAVERLGSRVELTILGTKVSEDCRPLNEALTRHRWIRTLPHAEVLREMSRHDVFVFPSLFEGFGLVLLEAMAQGLPIITTAHTAGPDLIEDGVEGFIIPIRSAEAIAEKLDLLAGDRELLSAMQQAARARAARHTWEHYRLQLSDVIIDALY